MNDVVKLSMKKKECGNAVTSRWEGVQHHSNVLRESANALRFFFSNLVSGSG